ncbi:hypothetical protein GCM10007276_07060 [Agaricicola taiwanensis]|uniref:Uncharacterized protein n=1 Tax=Agaricicola taiwanensis TaxID=591372 RepID=A0A8J2VJP5_9RHOB|nr:hypothetical protein [Agaricicola taiwanensis]GGE32387.1 hypothetical protein GCM10007276_07060 [Agaricicola taiwanensis]
MSIKTITDALERWEKGPARDASLKIVEYVSEHRNHVQLLTFKTLGNAVGVEVNNQVLLAAINILASPRIAALDIHAHYSDNDEEEIELDAREFAEVCRTGVFIHPYTGAEINDYQDRIYPFFVPSSNFLESND